MMTSWYGHTFFFVGIYEGNPTVIDDFFHKVPVMQSFDVFFFVSLNELFKKQLGWQLYRMLMWHHYNVHVSPLCLQEINKQR